MNKNKSFAEIIGFCSDLFFFVVVIKLNDFFYWNYNLTQIFFFFPASVWIIKMFTRQFFYLLSHEVLGQKMI